MTFRRYHRTFDSDSLAPSWEPTVPSIYDIGAIAKFPEREAKIVLERFLAFWEPTREARTWKDAWYEFHHNRPDRNTIRESMAKIGLTCTCHKDGSVTTQPTDRTADDLCATVKQALAWYPIIIIGAIEVVKPTRYTRVQFTFQEFGVC